MLSPVDIDLYQRDQQKLEQLSEELNKVKETLNSLQSKIIKSRVQLTET
jgi:septal ring factor EnvC (AmiA/AmiB activator)